MQTCGKLTAKRGGPLLVYYCEYENTSLAKLRPLKLHPLYFPVFLLQSIGTHGFATLNTTLYYLEHYVDRRVLLPSGWWFCLRASELVAIGEYTWWLTGLL